MTSQEVPGVHVLMLIENNPYPQDTRVRMEAQALQEAGCAVSVISPASRGQAWREEVAGVSVYRFPQPFEAAGFLGYVWEYMYSTFAMFLLSILVCARRPFAVIHAANPSDTLVFIAAAYKPFGVRFVYDHHDLSPELYDANHGGKGNRIVYHALAWMEKLSCRLADHVIATNESYKRIEMERGGVPASRITIVRNGPDLSCFGPVEPDLSIRQPGKTLIAYVGNIGSHDGVEHLLRALHSLAYDLKRTDFSCVLIGKAAAASELERLRDELGLSGYVEFTGWIPETQKLRYLSAADICVDPDPCNPFNDVSTMIKVAEYMALSKPIVAFDLRENRFTAQEAALFVSGNDEAQFSRALSELMDDPARRTAMGVFGRRRVESDLTWTQSVPRLLQAYRTLLGEAVPETLPSVPLPDTGRAQPDLTGTHSISGR